MITKINKLKNLGLVFADFTWSSDVPAFKSVNLIYGWNGSGKTTLTRLFDYLSTPAEMDFDFELEDSDGTRFHPTDKFPRPIRVFNQEYVRKNVRVLESTANTISITLGEQNKELVAQIEKDERALSGDPTNPDDPGKVRELQGYTQKRQRKEKGNDDAFSDIARTIGAAVAGSGVASRNYRRPDAERDFESFALPAVLSEKDLDARTRTLKQDVLQPINILEIPLITIDERDVPLVDLISECQNEGERVCATTVEAELVERLQQNSDIAEWVEKGRRIHAEHKSTTCEYCGNTITEERLSQLAHHFSEADQKLKARIEALLENLRHGYAAIDKVVAHDPARLYGELRAEFETKVKEFSEAKEQLLSEISEFAKTLQNKKGRTGEAVSLNVVLNLSAMTHAIDSVNEIAKAHNTKTQDFQKHKEQAVRDIKAHYLSTIYDDVKRRRAEIKELDGDLERRAKEISDIRERIASARAKVSSEHKACDQINGALCTFLGHAELHFEPDIEPVEDDKGGKTEAVVGYRIMRSNQPAVYLSEGEKTAIAFVYFVVHLADGQFPKDAGIVVIDDPISSFDSNSLYQSFSFLKNAVAGCCQVFVLTHNFDFLKLLLNWRRYFRGDTGYFAIRNYFVGDARRANIAEMDKELREYDSEYQYLFKRLKEMRVEQDGTLMRAYPVPNVARKVWDTFLMFRVPNSDNPYRKMELLKDEGFDKQKLDAIYKFTNDQSHMTGGGFDPALVPETKKVLDELFEMMEQIAPDHFAVLDKATS